MPAEILRCPACGAAASSDSTRCEYCRAALATVACPACFGMMFVGAKFCSHCGASAARTEVTAGDKQLCPRCQVDMQAVMIGSSNLRECPQCQGVWADVPTLQQICADHEKAGRGPGYAGASSRNCWRRKEFSLCSLPGVPQTDEPPELCSLLQRDRRCLQGARHLVRQR